LSRKLYADERGISPVLGATLLLATIITVVSIFLAVWIPSELSRREREYILGTEDTFRELKGTIEILNSGDNGIVALSMSPGSLPIIPNPKVAGTLSVIPADFEIRADSQELLRIPSENKIYTFSFIVLQGELEAYDWYIIAITPENQGVSSAFFYVNRPATGNYDYHYDQSMGTETTYPGIQGGMEADNALLSPLHVGQNFITVKVVSGPAGAWIDAYVVMFPAGTPLNKVNLENKSDMGNLRFDWGNWSLIYESGMVIFIKNNTILMESPPSLLTVKEDENNFEVYFNLFRVSGFEDSRSGTGTSNISISLPDDQPPSQPPITDNNVIVKINSNYMNIWTQYLANEVNELKGMGINATLDNVNGILNIMGDNKGIQYFRNVTNIEINLK